MSHWYWVHIQTNFKTRYLVYAKDREEAKLKVAFPSQEIDVWLASWDSIKEATGSEIPLGAAPTAIATGAIIFYGKKILTGIWPT